MITPAHPANLLAELRHARDHGCYSDGEAVVTSNLATVVGLNDEVEALQDSQHLCWLDEAIRAAGTDNVRRRGFDRARVHAPGRGGADADL